MPDKCRFFNYYLKRFFNRFIFVLLLLSGCARPDDAIRQAVEAQLKLYPASTLQDIYKSFFQDEFGPGHMAPDSAGAARYLAYELSAMTSRGNYNPEPCGTGRNFYRVPLDIVKDSLLTSADFLDAFLESATGFKEPNIDAWKARWMMIVAEIDAMGLGLPNYEADKEALINMLESGQAVVHHSQAYEQAYQPHYRILSLQAMEQLRSKSQIPNPK